MRFDLYRYVIENENVILIHNEMFPYKHKRILNLSTSEFSTFGYAKGLSLQGYKVIIFDVCGFSFFKNVYVINEIQNWYNVYICEGGAGFTYHNIRHHVLFNDLQIAQSLKCCLYSPITTDELYDILNTESDNLTYIRLYPECNPYVKLRYITTPIPVYAYGWIYTYLKTYIKPIFRWDLHSSLPYECLLIEDHQKWQNTKYWFGLQKEQALQGKESMNTFLLKAWKYVSDICRKVG